jgi:opacity protein-like surface antigen
MKVITKRTLVLMVFLLATAISSAAQRLQGPTGVVTANAPVFLRPDASRTPLRELPAKTIVYIQETRGDWVQVTFDDSQFGPRIGWMEQRFVSFRSPNPPTEADKPTTATRPPVAAPAARSEPDPPAPQPADVEPPRSRRDPLAVRGFGSFAFDKETARESFAAVLGSDSIRSFGGGVQVTNLVGGLFAEASFERSSDTGERVFVFGENVYGLGIPLRITQTPFDVAGGWRFAASERFKPYVGAGVTFMRYEETSDLPEADDDLDARETGYMAFAGLEIRAARWVHIRGEGRYRHIDNLLGAGGASGEFGETTLGGIGGSLKIVIGR